MSFLDDLIYGYRAIVDYLNVEHVRRGTLKFVGAIVEDDSANARTLVTIKDGYAEIDMNNANYTLTAEQASCRMIRVVAGSTPHSATRTLFFPTVATNAAAYVRHVHNANGQAQSITVAKTGGGTTVNLADGNGDFYGVTPAGVIDLDTT
jgi:hypothetical protein